MGRFNRKDTFYRRAKAEGHASRAFYKLGQIQERYKIIKMGDYVVDLGCAPGGWLEVASKIVGKSGKVVGVDILPIRINSRPNTSFIQADVNESVLVDFILDAASGIDVVLSDMAPSTSGIKFKDSYLSYELAYRALDIARKVLKAGGNFVVKIFPGEEFAGLKREISTHFEKVTQYKPAATRKSSIEIYLIGLGYK